MVTRPDLALSHRRRPDGPRRDHRRTPSCAVCRCSQKASMTGRCRPSQRGIWDDGMRPGADCEAPIRANMEVARERIRPRHARQSECLMPNLAGVNLDPLDAQRLLRK